MSERAPTQVAGTPASAWLEQVRYEERRGELLAAYDLALRGLEEHPDDMELSYRSVLALARTGATVEAERRYTELGLDRADSDEVAALWARIQKDRSLAASGETRRRLAVVAASLYQAIADRSSGYFPAINAATMSLLAGRSDDARRLASRSLDLVEASGEDSYYAAATRAEARLLLGELPEARQRAGARVHPQRRGLRRPIHDAPPIASDLCRDGRRHLVALGPGRTDRGSLLRPHDRAY